MVRWLKNILALAIVAFLFWYLAKHWDQLKVLMELSPTKLTIMYILTALIAFISAKVLQYLVIPLNIKPPLWEMFGLQNAALLLNYAPMKFGTIFRANYLKLHFGLSYAHFATFFLYMTFLMTLTASIIGVIVILPVYGIASYENQILFLIFLVVTIGSFAFLFFPLPVPKWQGRAFNLLRNFLAGRSQIASNKKIVAISGLLLTFNFILTAVRLGIIYNSLGQHCHPAGFLVLGAIGYSVLFIGLTPGGLGIRELVLGAGAVVIGLPLEVGLLAAVIDRMITFSYAFIIGGICTIKLWRKSPDDFTKNPN